MDTPNPSRQRKNHAKRIARKVKRDKGFGGKSNKDGAGTIRALKARFFGGSSWGGITVPHKVNHKRTNGKSNRQTISAHSKYKHRRAAKQ